MDVKAYSVLDLKTGAFGLPFFCHHDEMALRMVVEAVADERSSLSKYPADFCLYRLGIFNDQTGQIDTHPPEQLGVVAAIYASHLQRAGSTIRHIPDHQVEVQ